MRAAEEHGADPGRKLPYIYGTVRRPGPIYARLPGAEELKTSEPDLEERMQRWLEAEGEVGASYAQEVWNAGQPVEIEPRAPGAKRRATPCRGFWRAAAAFRAC